MSLAMRYLQIPATSSPSEWVFSSVGHTVVQNRASLDPSTVDKMVFLHSDLATKGGQKSCNLPNNSASPDQALPSFPKKDDNQQKIKEEAQGSMQEYIEAENPPLPSLPDV